MSKELSLLYVEDDSEILENVSFLFSKFVGKVYSAEDGETALELYKEHKPDVLVVDINLPKMSGLELAEIVKNDNPSVDVIIISAYNEESHLEKSKEIGVSSYLKKPFTLKELKETIAKL